MRTRHCHFCNKCVAMYDHHCNWIGLNKLLINNKLILGNCVGEKNKLIFYIYLLLLEVQNSIGIYIVNY